MPFFEGVAGRREVGASAQVGQDCEFVHQVGVLWPAGGDHVDGIEDEFVVDPDHDGVEPVPEFGSQLGFGAGRGHPRPLQVLVAERLSLLAGAGLGDL